MDNKELFIEEQEELAEEIAEAVEEAFIEECDFYTYSDYSGDCQPPGEYVELNSAPNLDDIIIAVMKDYKVKDDQWDDIKQLVEDNLPSEDKLVDMARENYCDRQDDYEDRW